MFPSSALQVVEQTPVRLVILDPPYYFLGGITVVCTLFAGLQFGLAFLVHKRAHPELGWLVLVLLLPFLSVGIGLLTSRSTITLSRQTGRVTIERLRFGMAWGKEEIPLEDVLRAGVIMGRNTRCLTVTLRSGEVKRLTSFSSQGGQNNAARALNNFLGVTAIPGGPPGTLPQR